MRYVSNVEDITEWREWALKPHTEDEIREKCLKDFNNVCFTFLCANSQMSEQFIEELIVLSTGLITEENYDKDFEKVKKAALINIGVLPKEKLNWSMDVPGTESSVMHASQVVDRLDWLAITVSQRLSEKFMRKYYRQLNWSYIPYYQKLTNSFYLEMKELLGKKIKNKKKDT